MSKFTRLFAVIVPVALVGMTVTLDADARSDRQGRTRTCTASRDCGADAAAAKIVAGTAVGGITGGRNGAAVGAGVGAMMQKRSDLRKLMPRSPRSNTITIVQ